MVVHEDGLWFASIYTLTIISMIESGQVCRVEGWSFPQISIERRLDVFLVDSLFVTAMPTAGHCLARSAIPAGKANRFHDGHRLISKIPCRLELVGTIECPGQTDKSISWSRDGCYVAKMLFQSPPYSKTKI